jgi:hypothetical protein
MMPKVTTRKVQMMEKERKCDDRMGVGPLFLFLHGSV